MTNFPRSVQSVKLLHGDGVDATISQDGAIIFLEQSWYVGDTLRRKKLELQFRPKEAREVAEVMIGFAESMERD